MSKVDSISVERLHELLHYDPETGIFTWRVDRSHNARAGWSAGHLAKGKGYILLRVDDVLVRAHRAAVAMVSGEWPTGVVDHINGVKTDNRFCNLRVVTQALNLQNQHKARCDNVVGLQGVYRSGKTKFGARVQVPGGRVLRQAGFDTPELAHEFYLLAKEMLHPGYVPPEQHT